MFGFMVRGLAFRLHPKQQKPSKAKIVKTEFKRAGLGFRV